MKEIIVSSAVKKDIYTKYIEDNFDLKVSDCVSTAIPFNLDLDSLGDWNIGLICGGSGSGKSTIMSKLGVVKDVEFDNSKPLISNFEGLEPKEVVNLFCAVGLCSVPVWLKPYNILSNGEKYRAFIAKSLYNAKDTDIVLIDEFTSVVDRNVAKSMSNSLQKYIRKYNKRIILASCHYDIIEWLSPNWIYDLNKGGALERGECLRRPKIELQMYRTEVDTWKMFKKHHYMTEELNKSAACYVFVWNQSVVGFVGVIPQPSGYFSRAVRGTRTVVLPEFQGLGIGTAITEFVASIYKAEGFRYFTKTVNPKLGIHRDNSCLWKQTSKNGRIIRPSTSKLNKKQKLRASYCHEYIGFSTEGCGRIIEKIESLRFNKLKVKQLDLFRCV